MFTCISPSRRLLPWTALLLFVFAAAGPLALAANTPPPSFDHVTVSAADSGAEPPVASRAMTNGLFGQYYDDMTLTDLVDTRIDSEINFNWGQGEPFPNCGIWNPAWEGGYSFSVRWTGFISVPTTGSYTFVLNVDDGGRMWIGGSLVYDRWADRVGDVSNQDTLPPMTLNAGQAYPIEIDYYNDAVLAVMIMSWVGPDGNQEVVPTEYLSTDIQGDNSGYTVSGTITLNGNPLAGVTVSDGTNSEITDSSGNYSISESGAYVLTPSLTGYTFSPATQTGTINGASATGVNFTATAVAETYTVSGTITLGGSPLEGVTVSDGTNSEITDSSGNYSISESGDYVLTPSLTDYIFSPATQTGTINGANVTGVNFTATLDIYSVSGTITVNGNPLAGVTVTCGIWIATTNSSGGYSIADIPNGTYTLTPSLANYTFTPAAQAITIAGANVTQNFTATQTVATPAFSLAAGTYIGAQTVTITCATSGATIHYTTNGSVPTASSPVYSTPISVATAMTVQALAMETGMTTSAAASAAYIIQVATPKFSPVAGAYSGAQTVTISCATSGATIHYTTDGSTPTASSTKYTAPVSLSTSTQLQAIAIETGMTNSLIISGVYNIAGSSTYVPDTDNDTDGNGYADEIKAALGVSLTNPSATPLNMQAGIAPQTLTLSKLSVKLNFAKTSGNDQIMASGSLPMPSGFAASSQTVVVDVGGVVKVFTLNSKGKGAAAAGYPAVTSAVNDHFGLKFKSKKGVIGAQTGSFTAQFNKGNFASSFADVGLVGSASVKQVTRTVPVIILFNSQMYQTAQAVQYTATANKAGLAQYKAK
jgi:hypothetical protein